MPETSVTEFIIVRSDDPTYSAISPEATVETITFGTPIGSARMPDVASAVPPLPPAPITPPTSRRDRRKRTNAVAIAAIALPRSPVKTASAPWG
jgi:hypothetical protein